MKNKIGCTKWKCGSWTGKVCFDTSFESSTEDLFLSRLFENKVSEALESSPMDLILGLLIDNKVSEARANPNKNWRKLSIIHHLKALLWIQSQPNITKVISIYRLKNPTLNLNVKLSKRDCCWMNLPTLLSRKILIELLEKWC